MQGTKNAMEPRRFGSVTRRGVGWGIGGLAAALITRSTGQEAAAKKKKNCKKPPRCPKSCGFVFYEPRNGEICGIGNSLQFNGSACIPCSDSNPCVSASFPHCLNSFEILNNGQISYFTNFCGQYTEGVCGNVSACVT